MDNEQRRILRTLELQNEARAQDNAIAYQKVADLEAKISDYDAQVANLNSQLEDAQSSGTTEVALESHVDFIKKIADSKSKFAKEAEDLITELNADA